MELELSIAKSRSTDEVPGDVTQLGAVSAGGVSEAVEAFRRARARVDRPHRAGVHRAGRDPAVALRGLVAASAAADTAWLHAAAAAESKESKESKDAGRVGISGR
jgi:hypothetical protein